MNTRSLITLGTASLLVSTLAFSSYANDKYNSSSSVSPSTSLIAQNQIMTVKSGAFVAGEAKTTGTAKIVKDGGHYYLELDGAFSTSDQGPDLHVLLEPSAKPPQTYQNINQAVNLGKLKSFSGSQRYPIPDAINLSQFKSVTIWCRMANATFGYAPLK